MTPFRGNLSLRDDETNLQALCAECHRLKSRLDHGHHSAALIPTLRERSAIPVTLVVGPPAAGKTTWVSSHAGPGAAVVDLDDIKATLAGVADGHAAPPETVRFALRIRNARLASLATETDYTAAIVVIGAPRAHDRRRLSDSLGAARVVVLETPAEVCHSRIRESSRPYAGSAHRAVDAWWRRYVRDRHDEVVLW